MLRNRKRIAVWVGAGTMLFGAGTRTWGQCEVQRLTTEDTVPPWRLNYGVAVDISANRAVVGAAYLQTDLCFDDCVRSGFAYVYRRHRSQWVEEARLAPTDGTLYDLFGETVSISGRRVIVGAWGSQSAYVFRRGGRDWVQAAKLVAWDDPGFNSFGRPVSISGNVVVVGADTDDEAAPRGGAAYVFRRRGKEWVPHQKLTPSDATGHEAFGRSVSVDGNYILVGSPGHLRDDHGSGWAYVFRYNGRNWVEQDHLIGTDTAIGDRFGNAVVLSGDRALIGAPYHDDPVPNVGAAYVFRRDGTTWVQEARLTPSGAGEGDLLGFGLALSNRHAFILDNDLDAGSGVVHVFERFDTTWIDIGAVAPRRHDGSRVMVGPLAIDDRYALIGTPRDEEEPSDAVRVYLLSEPCRPPLDYAAFERCFRGEGEGSPPGCQALDGERGG